MQNSHDQTQKGHQRYVTNGPNHLPSREITTCLQRVFIETKHILQKVTTLRTSDLRDQTVNGSLQVHCWLGVVQAVVQETLHGHVSHSASVCLPLFLSLPLSLSHVLSMSL